jgi:hypothetical protein
MTDDLYPRATADRILRRAAGIVVLVIGVGLTGAAYVNLYADDVGIGWPAGELAVGLPVMVAGLWLVGSEVMDTMLLPLLLFMGQAVGYRAGLTHSVALRILAAGISVVVCAGMVILLRRWRRQVPPAPGPN